MRATATRANGSNPSPRATRTSLTTAARDLFTRDGYEKTPVRAIAKRAGVTIGAFYNYFPSKRDVLREVVGEYARVGTWRQPASEATAEASAPSSRGRRRNRPGPSDGANALLLTLASFAHEDTECMDLLARIMLERTSITSTASGPERTPTTTDLGALPESARAAVGDLLLQVVVQHR